MGPRRRRGNDDLIYSEKISLVALYVREYYWFVQSVDPVALECEARIKRENIVLYPSDDEDMMPTPSHDPHHSNIVQTQKLSVESSDEDTILTPVPRTNRPPSPPPQPTVASDSSENEFDPADSETEDEAVTERLRYVRRRQSRIPPRRDLNHAGTSTSSDGGENEVEENGPPRRPTPLRSSRTSPPRASSSSSSILKPKSMLAPLIDFSDEESSRSSGGEADTSEREREREPPRVRPRVRPISTSKHRASSLLTARPRSPIVSASSSSSSSRSRSSSGSSGSESSTPQTLTASTSSCHRKPHAVIASKSSSRQRHRKKVSGVTPGKSKATTTTFTPAPVRPHRIKEIEYQVKKKSSKVMKTTTTVESSQRAASRALLSKRRHTLERLTLTRPNSSESESSNPATTVTATTAAPPYTIPKKPKSKRAKRTSTTTDRRDVLGDALTAAPTIPPVLKPFKSIHERSKKKGVVALNQSKSMALVDNIPRRNKRGERFFDHPVHPPSSKRHHVLTSHASSSHGGQDIHPPPSRTVAQPPQVASMGPTITTTLQGAPPPEVASPLLVPSKPTLSINDYRASRATLRPVAAPVVPIPAPVLSYHDRMRPLSGPDPRIQPNEIVFLQHLKDKQQQDKSDREQAKIDRQQHILQVYKDQEAAHALRRTQQTLMRPRALKPLGVVPAPAPSPQPLLFQHHSFEPEESGDDMDLESPLLDLPKSLAYPNTSLLPSPRPSQRQPPSVPPFFPSQPLACDQPQHRPLAHPLMAEFAPGGKYENHTRDRADMKQHLLKASSHSQTLAHTQRPPLLSQPPLLPLPEAHSPWQPPPQPQPLPATSSKSLFSQRRKGIPTSFQAPTMVIKPSLESLVQKHASANAEAAKRRLAAAEASKAKLEREYEDKLRRQREANALEKCVDVIPGIAPDSDFGDSDDDQFHPEAVHEIVAQLPSVSRHSQQLRLHQMDRVRAETKQDKLARRSAYRRTSEPSYSRGSLSTTTNRYHHHTATPAAPVPRPIIYNKKRSKMGDPCHYGPKNH